MGFEEAPAEPSQYHGHRFRFVGLSVVQLQKVRVGLGKPRSHSTQASNAFFTKCPIPATAYNCDFNVGRCEPNGNADDSIVVLGASEGINLDPGLILEIARGSSNAVGAELT